MARILFVSAQSLINPTTGGAKISKRNMELLSQNGEVDVSAHGSGKRTLFQKVFDFLFNPIFIAYYYKEYKMLKRQIKDKECANTIFFDSSLFGRIVKLAKKKGKKVIVHFHNIERCYYEKADRKNGLAGYLIRKNVNKNEMLSVKYADKIILLNERDKRDLIKYYGNVDNSKITFLPISLKDNYTEKQYDDSNIRKIGLFFGTYFPPNYNGIKWFVQNVMPLADFDLIIAGKGFDALSEELTNDNIKIIDKVDNIEQLFDSADFFVSPIFEGSGMKVKTCEALKFGKTIFGTTESFEGYELDFDKVGGLCNTKEEFIQKINSAIANGTIKKFNEYSRDIYLKKYSDTVIKEKISSLFASLEIE